MYFIGGYILPDEPYNCISSGYNTLAVWRESESGGRGYAMTTIRCERQYPSPESFVAEGYRDDPCSLS